MRWTSLQRLALALALAIAVSLGACTSPIIQVRSWPSGPPSLSGKQSFRVTSEPAPVGCRPLGQVAFETRPRNFHTALMRLRRRVLRAGGNRVAMLRCEPARPRARRAYLLLSRSRPIKAGHRIYCAGELYRDRGLIRR